MSLETTHAIFGVSIDKNLLAALAAHEWRDLCELASGALALDTEGLEGHLVLVEAGGVAPAAKEEGGVSLLGADNLVFDALVDGGLDGAHEARAHVDAAGAEAEGGSEAPAVCEAS